LKLLSSLPSAKWECAQEYPRHARVRKASSSVRISVCHLKFKEEAKHLYLDSNVLEDLSSNSVVQTDQGGQLSWKTVIGRMREFDYEDEYDGLALKWHVAGRSSPIIIDPRLRSVPRPSRHPDLDYQRALDAGESDSDIAEDFKSI